jgi:PPOX class probable F420-dependent enzyme
MEAAHLQSDRWRLITFRRSGSTVESAVHCGVQDGRLYARLEPTDPAVERLWNVPLVKVAPCTRWGRRTGPPVEAAARVLRVEEEQVAIRALQGASRKRSRLPRPPWSRNGTGGGLYVEIVP